MGGGVGGGLFDVVMILFVFNKLWECDLLFEELVKFGVMFGVDVLVFINGYIVIVYGIGE